MRVLDIGCGSGSDLTYLRQKFGMDCYGIDIALDDSIRSRAEKGLFFTLADASHLPFKDDSFDFVYSFGVLEHTHRIDLGLRESFRVARIGGQVLHTVPNMFSLHTLLARPLLILMHKWQLGHERSFTLSKLARMFQKVGFVSLKWAITPFDIRTTPKSSALITETVTSFKRLDNLISNIVPWWGFFIAILGLKTVSRGKHE